MRLLEPDNSRAFLFDSGASNSRAAGIERQGNDAPKTLRVGSRAVIVSLVALKTLEAKAILLQAEMDDLAQMRRVDIAPGRCACAT